jgi:tetratricopeptide (TPR) repeat protein
MPTDDILSVIGRADDLYHRRGEPGAVREAVMILSGTGGSAQRYEVQWRLSRALFFLGQEANSRESARQLYSAGIGAGERAVELNYERVEGHFWVGVNLSLFASVSHNIRGVRALRWARSELKRAAAINECYHDAGPLRVLGRLEHKAPRILGGNLKRSRKLLDRALAIAPRNSVTLAYAAELAMELGNRDNALSLLNRIIESPPDAEWEFENQRDRILARSLIDQLSRT